MDGRELGGSELDGGVKGGGEAGMPAKLAWLGSGWKAASQVAANWMAA